MPKRINVAVVTILSGSLTACVLDSQGVEVTSICLEGAVEDLCLCGSRVVEDGYCCNDSPQTTACNTAVCGNGLVTTECDCGDVIVASGYCCEGIHQDSACVLTTLRLDAGLESGISTHDGKVFFPLLPYLTDGDARDSNLDIPIANTEFDGLYKSETWVRVSPVTFGIPVENGLYSVHLHFVDFNPNEPQEPEDRLFHVDIEGIRQLSDLDIIAEVGKNAALIKGFVVLVEDNAVTLTITNHVFCGTIAAIEILPAGEPALATTGWSDCAEEEVTSTCDCGSTLVWSGYCCNGSAQETACGGSVCANGLVTAECDCGGVLVTDGYCCAGNPQTEACADYGGGGVTYYIDPNGSDVPAGGSIGNPWRSLAYACSLVATAGDVIHVNPGIYTEATPCLLAVGVSLEGAGDTSVIRSHISTSGTYTIQLSSASEGTMGNQHISNLKMDGDNLTAYGAIKILRRSNVSVHDCAFVDFDYYGIHFLAGAEPPTTYATGNRFFDNVVINCSGFYSEGKFAVGVDGQDGMSIHGNVLDQTSRSPGHNGYLIKGVEGYNRGMKIFDNTIDVAPYSPGTFGFAIELWDCRGGVEIYDNVITGVVDIGGYHTQKESYPYAVYIHDNTIGPTSLGIYESQRGVILEGDISDVIVSNNLIKNVAQGVYFSQVGSNRWVYNVDVYYNIITNVGVADGGSNSKGWGINWSEESNHNHAVHSINIWNNVIIGHVGARSNMWGIKLPNIGTTTNVSIRNNIIENFDYAPVFGYAHAGTETIDVLSIENNIFSQNGSSNLPLYSGLTPTNNTTQNNLTTAPPFVSLSDYHLTAARPGIFVREGLTDMDGDTVESPPTIGAYEYP